MDTETFIAAVAEMRRIQSEYENRGTQTLWQKKESAERRVDAMLAEYERKHDDEKEQLELFNGS